MYRSAPFSRFVGAVQLISTEPATCAAADELDQLDDATAGVEELDELLTATEGADDLDELTELTTGAEELEDELDTEPVAPTFSSLNQFTLNPPFGALIPKWCFPAGKVIVRSTVIHFCQPALLGIGALSNTLLLSRLYNSSVAPVTLEATR